MGSCGQPVPSFKFWERRLEIGLRDRKISKANMCGHKVLWSQWGRSRDLSETMASSAREWARESFPKHDEMGKAMGKAMGKVKESLDSPVKELGKMPIASS